MSSKLKNVKWKLNLCLLRRYLYTIQCHVTTLYYLSWLFGSSNWPRLPLWIGFCTARWQWQHVRVARARSSKQNTRANISVFWLPIWPSIRLRAINSFNECLFGFYSHWKVWYKSEKAFGMCSQRHTKTRSTARCHISTRQSLSLCNAILNTCQCLLAIDMHYVIALFVKQCLSTASIRFPFVHGRTRINWYQTFIGMHAWTHLLMNLNLRLQQTRVAGRMVAIKQHLNAIWPWLSFWSVVGMMKDLRWLFVGWDLQTITAIKGPCHWQPN